jgi:hypothetical protein
MEEALAIFHSLFKVSRHHWVSLLVFIFSDLAHPSLTYHMAMRALGPLSLSVTGLAKVAVLVLPCAFAGRTNHPLVFAFVTHKSAR